MNKEKIQKLKITKKYFNPSDELRQIKCLFQNFLCDLLQKCESFSPYEILMNRYFEYKYGNIDDFTEIGFDVDAFMDWVNANNFGRFMKLIYNHPTFAKNALPLTFVRLETAVVAVDKIIDILKNYTFDVNIDTNLIQSIDKIENLFALIIKNISETEMSALHSSIKSAARYIVYEVMPKEDDISDDMLKQYESIMVYSMYALLVKLHDFSNNFKNGEYDFDRLTYENICDDEIMKKCMNLFK